MQAIRSGDAEFLRRLMSKQCPDYFGVQYIEAKLALEFPTAERRYSGLDVLFDAHDNAQSSEVASCLYDAITRAIGQAGGGGLERRRWFDQNREKLLINESYLREIERMGVEASERGPHLLVLAPS